jgi:hypothetical protein
MRLFVKKRQPSFVEEGFTGSLGVYAPPVVFLLRFARRRSDFAVLN